MQPPRNVWPTGDAADHVLFVAQLFREMLSTATYESFRAPSLDTISRVAEVGMIALEIKRERVPIAAISAALEELSYYLGKDAAIREISPSEIDYFQSTWKSGKITEKDVLQISRFARSLHEKLSSEYRSVLERLIVQSRLEPKKKDYVRKICADYCSHLINSGYSRQYILSQVNSRFFSNDIKKIEKRTLERFFRSFDGAEAVFQVTIPVSNTLAKYLSSFKRLPFVILAADEINPQASSLYDEIKSVKKITKFVTGRISAKDNYSAARKFIEALDTLISITYLARRGVELEWTNSTYVKRIRAVSGEIISLDQIVLQRKSLVLTNAILRDIRDYGERIIFDFDEMSMERLVSAVNMSAISRSSYRPENQLITLWSAFEVLMDDPPKGVARISHYINIIIPAICITYPGRYSRAVFDEIYRGNRTHFRTFFSKSEFNPADDMYIKFVKLVFRDDLKHLHNEFCTGLGRNPLALYRLSKLERDFGKPADLLAALSAHEQRVNWQISRIYRTRNDIVHSGAMPVFLNSLVMNVFEYFKSALVPVLNRASGEQKPSNIDQIVAEVGFQYAIMKSDLERLGDKRFNIEQINRFIK